MAINERSTLEVHQFAFQSDGIAATHLEAQSGQSLVVPDAHLLFTAEFKKSGSDLILTGEDGNRVFIHDYFRGEKRPDLYSPEGAVLTADVVTSLAGAQAPLEYAQAGSVTGAAAIGRVIALTGTATALRNGVLIELHVGDAVQKGDVIQTMLNSSVGINFLDGTIFNLQSSARMVLDEFIFDPNGTANAAVINLVQGAIGFIAGKVAKTGEMRVETPVANLGIRGTWVLAQIDLLDGTSTMSILDNGEFIITDKAGNVLQNSLQGVMTVVSPDGSVTNLSKTDFYQQLEQAIFQQLQTLFQISPFKAETNPQSIQSSYSNSSPPSENPYKFSFDPIQRDDTIITVTFDDDNPDTPPQTFTLILPIKINSSILAIGEVTEDILLNSGGPLDFTGIDTGGDVNVNFVYNDDADWTDGALTPEQIEDIISGFSVDSSDWSYSVDNQIIQFLGQGEIISLSFDVTVTGGSGTSKTETVIIKINGVEDPPTATKLIADQPATEDSAFSFTVPTDTFTDVDVNDSLTLSATLSDGSALPGWLSFNAATGEFSGTPANGDVGTISVKVTATDGSGEFAYDTFDITIANVDDEATGTLGVTGTAQEGGSLVASLTGVSDADGSTTIAYKWQELISGVWTDISGQTNATLTIPDDQSYVGKNVRVVATTTDALGGTTVFESAGQTIANVDDEATGTLGVTGTAQEGGSLVASLTGVSDADGSTTIAYKWQELISGVWTDISGQTNATLTIPDDQSYVGKNVRVVATTTDALGGTTVFESAGQTIANVDDEATGTLGVTGTAQEGGSLVASLTGVSDADGSTTIAYKWQELISGVWTDISGQTNATLTIPDDQSYVGKEVRVVAITTDGFGGTTEFESAGQTIANVNDTPAIEVDGAAAYTIGGGAVAVDSTITVSDVDSTQIKGAQVQITTNRQAGDVLNFVNQSGISGSFDSATGLLTLVGLATLVQYEAAIASITFSTTSTSTSTRTISFQVTDTMDAASAIDTATVSVSPPPLTANGETIYVNNDPIDIPEWLLLLNDDNGAVDVTNVVQNTTGGDSATHSAGGAGTGSVSFNDGDTSSPFDGGTFTYQAIDAGGNTSSAATVTISNQSGSSTITGTSGADILFGAAGNDTLAGGADNDTYVFRAAGDGNDTINDSGGTADRIVIGTLGAALTQLNFERDNFDGSGVGDGDNDDLRISYNGQTITILNHYGADDTAGGVGKVEQITFLGGASYLGYSIASGPYTVNSIRDGTAPLILDGTAGNDIIADRQGGRTLNGFDGNDLLFGNDDADILNGGNGNDLLVGGASGDTVNGGAGNDTIGYVIGDGGDTVNGGADSDTFAIIGTGSNELIAIVVMSNVITQVGGGGSVTAVENFTLDMLGGTGDTLSYANTLAAQSITVNLATGSATGFTSPILGVENVTGGAGNDTLTGDSNANTLNGGSGADTIDGGAGGDILIGSGGADTIDTGAADDNVQDIVRFTAVTEFGDTVSNFDADGTSDLVQFTGTLNSEYDDGLSNDSFLFASGNGDGLATGATADIGPDNGDYEALILTGANGEGVTNANLGSASLVAAAFNAEFNIISSNGHDALLVINDTDANSFALWRYVENGTIAEIQTTGTSELTLIGIFNANATVTTSSFGLL